MDSRVGAPRTKILWLFVAAACAAALAASFSMKPDVVGAWAERIWTARFIFAGGLFLCLGMFFRNAGVKSVMFSLLAGCAALGIGEAYLSHIAARNEQVSVQAVDEPTDFPVEFADELRDLYAGPGGSSDDDGADAPPTRFLVERQEVNRFKRAAGVDNPDEYITYNEEQTGDPILGYRPVPKAGRIAAIKVQGDRVIYDVTYTLLPSGWRVTPQHPDAVEAVVFFGCSYTFGEGLDDKDTYPYKVGELLGDRYQVFNFGFHGYGSHHMLAMIENGYLDDIAAKYEKMHVFYMTIAGHELRSAGKSSWDKNGPWYELVGDQVVHRGKFSDQEKRAEQRLPMIARFGEQQMMEKLHVAIMKQADTVLEYKYGAHLNVIAWSMFPYPHAVKEQGLPLLDISRQFPDTFRIRYDGHPNRLGTSFAARRIVDTFFPPERRADG